MTTVAAAANQDRWQVSRGRRDGRVIFTRFNLAFATADDRADYGIQVGVAVPLIRSTRAGLPRRSEFGPLKEIEDLIRGRAEGRAVLVGVITAQSMREWVLYTEASFWVPEFHQELLAQITHHEIQVMAQPDPSWDTYRSFVR